ncbi:AC2 [Melon chlorotic mosaic virus]|uniref:Transcriptional activator protein n=1 Tax=Melon chlorotic mosaic virus TaxID=180399 RepID=D9ZNP8_9GEMI|nr:AC2 [Melon chlorotic mosaic virus]ADK97752.1 AC2 [Melon chlorotic mosaic virus]
MLTSSSSTPPSIKTKHRIAKKKGVRRRRIDLNCGCSIFVHIACAENGFTHGGEHHCLSGREFRFYLDGSKSPVFQNIPRRTTDIHKNQNLPHTNQVQPQLEEGTGSTPSFSQLPNLDDFTDSFWDDLFK